MIRKIGKRNLSRVVGGGKGFVCLCYCSCNEYPSYDNSWMADYGSYYRGAGGAGGAAGAGGG